MPSSLFLKDAQAGMRTYKVLLHGMGAGAAIWCLNIDSMVETGRIVRTAVHYGALHAPQRYTFRHHRRCPRTHSDAREG